MWGKTVTIELDHSDFDLTELMEIYKGLTIASGFSPDSWNSVIKDQSAQIHEDEMEDLKEKLNEWKTDDEYKHEDLRHSFGNWVKDSEGHEDYDGQFKDWVNETPIEDDAPFKEFGDEDDEMIEEDDEEVLNKRMNIIGQNGNEGTHYGYDWDNDNSYEGETNDILTNINDSIQIIKDKMEDIDLRMDNIDEQLDILNADVANIEYSIENPIKQSLIDGMNKYNYFNDVVDMDNGEVTNNSEVGYDEDGGFGVKKVNKSTIKKLNKSIVKRGKIKDLKK
jgi:hypothetical protein